MEKMLIKLRIVCGILLLVSSFFCYAEKSIDEKRLSTNDCDTNLYDIFSAYREAVLSTNFTNEKVYRYLKVKYSNIENPLRYSSSLRLQQANIVKVNEYYFSCKAGGGGDLYLKLDSFELDMTRAHVKFEFHGGVFKIKYMSLENTSMEKHIDQEGTFQHTLYP